jgi:hypothetical protein
MDCKKPRKTLHTDQSAVVDKVINGFDAYRTYSFSSSLGTTIYGTFNFEKIKEYSLYVMS